MLPACTTVSEGHVISLTVKCDLDAELDNKVNSFILHCITCLYMYEWLNLVHVIHLIWQLMISGPIGLF